MANRHAATSFALVLGAAVLASATANASMPWKEGPVPLSALEPTAIASALESTDFETSGDTVRKGPPSPSATEDVALPPAPSRSDGLTIRFAQPLLGSQRRYVADEPFAGSGSIGHGTPEVVFVPRTDPKPRFRP